MHSPINWCEVPDPYDQRPMMKIVSAPDTGFIDLVVMSDTYVGVWTHWYENRTTPCTAGNGCVCETMEMAARWKAYLCCSLTTDIRLVLAELTGDAVRESKIGHLSLYPHGLRGLTIRLSRKRRHKTGRVQVEVLAKKPYDDQLLPLACDVKKELMRIWLAKR